ncbi:MAG: tocopherol cyclase family protein [Spirochaetia bacterium]|jgi:hypothetical protein|nr:tocopherol cyclase family protein [Spirochaetia bacterium]
MGNPWRSEAFQGKSKRRAYFEGWYFKQTGGQPAGAWSFIPGIALGSERGEGYAFVQALEGSTGKSWWFEYPLNAFSASSKILDVRVGPNRFSARGIQLELENGETAIRGSLNYGAMTSLSRPFWSPGVMGPFSFVPGMECNHGLVSLDHRVEGWIMAGDIRIEFENGRGYIEKDWGKSMPQAWLWIQSNDFAFRGDSAMLSVARIPWASSAFTGFLCASSLGGSRRLFTTYTKARIASLAVNEHQVFCRIERPGSRTRAAEAIEFEAGRARGGTLRAPVSGLLSRRISEAVDARLSVRYFREGVLKYEAETGLAGLEVVGDLMYQNRVPGYTESS